MTVSGAQLALEHRGSAVPNDFVGINGYELTSDWSVNSGCGYGGWTTQSLAAFFSALRPGALVRTWFFQARADRQGQRDWTALDRVVTLAARHRVRLIAVLGNQNGQCEDGSWKDIAWYEGGYRQAVGDRESFAGWVHDAVARYAPSRTVALWEPVNEPNPLNCAPGADCYSQGACPNEGAVSRTFTAFFTAVGGMIHQEAPTALVADGSIGTADCGTANDADYRQVIASPGLDVTDYHDYSPIATTLPSDLRRRINDARVLGKASMIDEAGVSGCDSAQVRAEAFRRKMTAAFAVGITAYLPWYYGGDEGRPDCNTPIDTDSPTWALLQNMTWVPPRPPVGTPHHERLNLSTGLRSTPAMGSHNGRSGP
ncbi:MAG: hypothetical protein M3063_03490 [Actinomycetota bacterium]|nr:hypothetical protein [Actinomycetota bacterium]MDQ6945201.1 hypothetical protein [Actinomycetota bacterium]